MTVNNDLTWQKTNISSIDREKLNGHKGGILWFTGLSGSGKSTVAAVIEENLHSKGVRTYLLDGDNIRHGLNKDLGFSPEDRKENIRRISEVAKLFVDAGLIVLVSFISPYRKDREFARSLVLEGKFIEIHVDCPVEVCENRDVKGLYQKARQGIIKDFTGITAPYEKPDNPEIILKTAEQSIETCAIQVIKYLQERGFIK